MPVQNNSEAPSAKLSPRRLPSNRKKPRHFTGIAAVISFLLLPALGWYYHHWRLAHQANVQTSATDSTKHSGKDATASPVPVVATTVLRKEVPIYFNGIGTVQAYNTVTVSSRQTGQITTVAFKEGQDVKVGDLLAIVDPRPYQATLDQAVAKKAEDEAQLQNARTLYQRDTYLLQKKVLDPSDFDTQRYLVDQYAAAVQYDAANIESAQVNLDYCKITSPIDGRVGIRLLDQGNIVQGGSTTAVCTITQLRPISLLFTLPQTQLGQVNEEAAKGPLRVLAVDTTNTRTLSEGVLAVVNNQIDTTTGTFQLKATFQNQDLKLWPGEFVNARLLITTRKDGLVVPAAAVQRGHEGTFTYVIDSENIARKRVIKVNQVGDGVALIDDGLNVGEKVVVDGQYRLQPDSKVQIISHSPSSSDETSANSLKQNSQP